MERSLSLHSFAVNLLILGAGLSTSAMLARWLEPAGRGEVAAAMLWPIVAIYLACLGMMEAILYFAALPGADPGPIFATSLIIAIVQSLIVLPPAYLVMPWLLTSQSRDVVNASRLYLLVIPLSLISQYNISILHARFQIRSMNLMRLLIPAGSLAGIALLFAAGRLELQSIIVMHLGLNAALLLATCLRLRSSLSVRPDALLARRLLRYGLVAHLGSVSQSANLKLDQMMLAAFFAPAQLGIYVVAMSASSLTQALSTAITIVLRPTITSQTTRDQQDEQLRRGFAQYWTLSTFLTVGMGVFLFWAIPAIFGNAYGPSIWPAEILLLAALMAGAKEVLSGGTRARGDAWLSSKADIVAAVVMVSALPVLLWIFGVLGAALATTFATACGLGMLIRGVSRTGTGTGTGTIVPRELFRPDPAILRTLVAANRPTGYPLRPSTTRSESDRLS